MHTYTHICTMSEQQRQRSFPPIHSVTSFHVFLKSSSGWREREREREREVFPSVSPSPSPASFTYHRILHFANKVHSLIKYIPVDRNQVGRERDRGRKGSREEGIEGGRDRGRKGLRDEGIEGGRD